MNFSGTIVRFTFDWFLGGGANLIGYGLTPQPPSRNTEVCAADRNERRHFGRAFNHQFVHKLQLVLRIRNLTRHGLS